ncbi:LuxR C-terminal-related transcriptional regulator [Providencia vermicola]|uniref:Response regulator n=4 Tax=Providencia TaxID=586 RepID=A0AAI9MXS3_PROST|nr:MULTISPECIES: LuxR C-terminal-related transcriptional regulator [Providencia]ELR5046120.1 response regulator [Providencia rettgeri]ELR5037344.1 response regulator [Providencia stuartii]ELR5120332.1 response regulator [Providencia stuartii]ELR5143301.1 response regulator [Providencia stuartii]ELR5292066.1 response regulator [Providencia stuartii]
MINIIIIDDNNILIRGLEAIFNRHKRCHVVASFPFIEQAISWNRKQKANIILINSDNCQFESLKNLQTLRRTQPDVGIIIYNIHNHYAFLLKALELGIQGVLSAKIEINEFLEAIQIVNARSKIISPDIAQAIALKRIHQNDQTDIYELLSTRELEIMLFITQGISTKQIAQLLNLSPKTVNTYRYRMFGKLNIRSDVELTHIAISYGLIVAKQGLLGCQNSSNQKLS